MITKPIVLDETLQKTNDELHKIALAIGGETHVETWEEIRIVARAGKMKQALQIGQEFIVPVYNMPALVMGFIDEGRSGSIKIKDPNLQNGVIFQFKDCPYSLQFDSAEAFHTVEGNAIPAGTTVHFTIPTTYSSWLAGDYQFTLVNNAPVGTQFCFSGNAGTALTSLKVIVYASSNSTEVVEQCVISAGSGGTNLGSLNGVENNHPQRISYGNNRWKLSAMRQQLNSDAVAGSVWIPQHKWDRPPSWKTNKAGFLNGLPTTFTDYLAELEIDTYRNTVTDEGGLDTTTDKIFLAGRNEIFMPTEGADNGVAWDYYKIGSNSQTMHTGADPVRSKKSGTSNTYWWLRSPYVGHAFYVRGVSPDGSNDGITANTSGGVSPAFVIA